MPKTASSDTSQKGREARVVFFDLGGTLLVMRRDRIFRRVLSELGYEVPLSNVHLAYVDAESWWLTEYGNKVMTPAETSEAYRTLDEKVFGALFPRKEHPEAQRVSGVIRKRWPELEGEIPLELYPDAEPTLHRLKEEGYTLGLVSNAPPDTGRAVETLGLSKYMQSVIISGVVGYSKPNPEIFRVALRDVGAKPEEAVHVGDLYEADILGARNAGIRGILIDRDSPRPRADCPCIRSLSEIFAYLT